MTPYRGSLDRVDRAPSAPAGPPASGLEGGTPSLRLFALLEVIASRDQLCTLPGLVAETGLPKPTVHRMLAQLESADLVSRHGDARAYGVGARLRRLAEDVLLSDTTSGARHAVLQRVVDEIGESCNLTVLTGAEVVYLDRVETPEPLRFSLRPGSRVPSHASASGKMVLSQLNHRQRARLLGPGPLPRYTEHTITDLDRLDAELQQIRADGYALDQEEYLPGLVCVAVLVPTGSFRSTTCLAAQAPRLRMSVDQVLQILPTLREAAERLGAIERDLSSPPSAAEEPGQQGMATTPAPGATPDSAVDRPEQQAE